MNFKQTIRCLLAAMLMFPAIPAPAEDRQLVFIVPGQPGGTTDKIARLVGERMEAILSSRIVVINKAGASGTIAIAEVAKAPADGSTLGIVFDAHAVNHHVFRNLPYDTFKSFEYISLLISAPHVVVTSRSTPYQSFRQLLDAAKANPDKVSFGSLGAGTSNHLYPMLLARRAGAQMLAVPYTGTGGTFLADLLEGRFDFAMGSLPFAKPYLATGQLRALAYAGSTRSPELPALETVAETFPGFEASSWVGVIAPKGLPAAKIRQLSDAFAQALSTEPLKSKLTNEGYVIEASGPQQFLRKVIEESERLAPFAAAQSSSSSR
ncbi:MAG TPA: tripartite tricarboxylate transporter substrate-binding protein [Burkholderiaceae bacterium]|nr:tripartite tricarboxylate transporter substrate-binding protein [Burkholderiaceae bacterium]